MIKVLLICDKAHWAYDAIAKGIVKYNTDKDVYFKICYMKDSKSAIKSLAKKYDLLFFMGWQLLLKEKKRYGIYQEIFPFLDNKKILTGIHSHHAWDSGLTRPERDILPPLSLIETLSRFKGVNVVSLRLMNLFAKSGLKRCRYTPNGVDDELFRPIKPIGRNPNFVTVGFSGTKKHDFEKGISQYIEPLRKYDWIRLKLAMPQGDYVPLNEMPLFYNEIDIYLCASSAEGFSLSVLEASSCGRPLLSTNVGANRELLKDGYNGLFVKRDIDDIVSKVEYLHKKRGSLITMGLNNRREIEEKWTWRLRVKDWVDFVKESAVR